MIRRTFLMLMVASPIFANNVRRSVIFFKPVGRFYELRCDDAAYMRAFLEAYQDELWPEWRTSEMGIEVQRVIDKMMAEYENWGRAVMVDVGSNWLRVRFWAAAGTFNLQIVGEDTA